MKVNSSAVSLNVQDVAASSRFLQQHFGFRETLAPDGFASLTRDDAGMNVVYLRRGLPTCLRISATSTPPAFPGVLRRRSGRRASPAAGRGSADHDAADHRGMGRAGGCGHPVLRPGHPPPTPASAGVSMPPTHDNSPPPGRHCQL